MILELFDQETVELVPDKIIMKKPKELTQYFIQSWSLRFKEKGIGGIRLIKYHRGQEYDHFENIL